jgi:hypothetical protein
MNTIHVHHLFNRASQIGCGSGVLLLAYGVVNGQRILMALAFALFMLSAIAALFASWATDPVASLLERDAHVPVRLIEAYQEAVFITLILMLFVGLVSGLWLFLTRSLDMPIPVAAFTGTLGAFAAALQAWTMYIVSRIERYVGLPLLH